MSVRSLTPLSCLRKASFADMGRRGDPILSFLADPGRCEAPSISTACDVSKDEYSPLPADLGPSVYATVTDWHYIPTVNFIQGADMYV
jgi:hypothetical protein